MKIETVGLLGVGRFGQMVLQHLREVKTLRAYDEDPAKLTGLIEASSLEETAASDLVVLCVPISDLQSACRRIAPFLRPGQVVVDTCSVKELPIRWMIAALPSWVDILGTHPLFGPDSGKETIAGLKIALCPVRIGPEQYGAIRCFLESLQLVLIETTPEEHDRQIARSQAIFHLVAQALRRLDWGGQAISTPGPDSFYRLAQTVLNDTTQLFLDLNRSNPFASEYRRQFLKALTDLDRELSSELAGPDPSNRDPGRVP